MSDSEKIGVGILFLYGLICLVYGLRGYTYQRMVIGGRTGNIIYTGQKAIRNGLGYIYSALIYFVPTFLFLIKQEWINLPVLVICFILGYGIRFLAHQSSVQLDGEEYRGHRRIR